MNKIITPKTGPKGIFYLNDTPYMYGIHINPKFSNDIIRIGSKGEKVSSAVFWSLWRGGEFLSKGIKVANNLCYFTELQTGSIPKSIPFKLFMDGVVGAVSSGRDRVLLIRLDGTVIDSSIEDLKSLNRSHIFGIDYVKNFFNLSDRGYGILQDSRNRLLLWGEGGINESFQIPGENVKQILSGYHTQSEEYVNYILTDKGLFINLHSKTPLPSFLAPDDEEKPARLTSDHYRLYEIPLPENISPNNIEEISCIDTYNLFIRTNEGKVYAIGKNSHYQRGTTEELEPDKWNEIKYPEKIKQLAGVVCSAYGNGGLFALSENGNLYYHGFNLENYFPIVNKKSSIHEPIKIAEDIKSIWQFERQRGLNFVGESLIGNSLSRLASTVFLLKHSGDLSILPTKAMMTSHIEDLIIHSASEAYPVKLYREFFSDLIFSPNMVKAIAEIGC